jgi:hypothetical protein
MKSQNLKLRMPVLFSTSDSKSPQRLPEQDYVVGLRGVFVIQSFLFVFFQVFLPTAIPDSKNVDGFMYQKIFRKTFSVIFANESLIYSWFIFLSARTLALPYLGASTRQVCASSIFRRGVRLWLPTMIAFSLAAAAFSLASTAYITEFLTRTKNISTAPPMRMRNFLVYFNSLFDIFWVTKAPSYQAANQIFASGTLWIVSVLFQQSYTVYMTMTIVPYTRASWRVKALLGFIAGAFWVQSWAWYSVSGLLITDAVLNMDLKHKSRRGFALGKVRVPMWPLYALLVVGGFVLQFLFIAWRPALRDKELYGHTGLYTTGNLNEEVDAEQPLARVDNYLIMIGTMLLIETFELPQKVLASRPFVALGRRSFSECFTYAVYSLAFRQLLMRTRCFPRPVHHHLHGGYQAVVAPGSGRYRLAYLHSGRLRCLRIGGCCCYRGVLPPRRCPKCGCNKGVLGFHGEMIESYLVGDVCSRLQSWKMSTRDGIP